ncbi:MAG TPA: hypothetical protein DCS05_09175 [Nitrospiraceae bacterium]|nr:hypothetical protein [Nitrospiraceae bacterium]
MISTKQAKILASFKTVPTLTLADAVRLIGGNIYCNAEKHVGATLSNMVRRGLIVRVKPGVFELPNLITPGTTTGWWAESTFLRVPSQRSDPNTL